MAKRKGKGGPGAAPPAKVEPPKAEAQAHAASAPGSPDLGAPGPVPGGFALGVLAAMAVASCAALYLLYGYMMKTYGPAGFESACNFSETFNCDKLNTSDHGKFGEGTLGDGLPITLFALGAYAGAGVLAGLLRKRRVPEHDGWQLLLFGAGASVAYGLQLLYVMAAVEHTFCVFCLTMDGGALAVLVLSWLALRRLGPRTEPWELGRSVLRPAIAGAGTLGLLLGIFFGWKRGLEDQQIAQLDAELAGPVAGADGAVVMPSPGAAASLEEARAQGKPWKLDPQHYYVPVFPDDASIGPKDAKVTVVEYADFQCGYCKKLFYSLTPLKEKYKDEVRFVFKHFPMNTKCNDAVQNDKHRYACGAAVAGECARRQGKFWPMHDLLFRNQHKLEEDDLRYYAGKAGLDLGEFDRCTKDGSALQHVKRDIEIAKGLEINSTPRSYINTRYLRGPLPQRTLEHVIEQELGRMDAAEPMPGGAEAVAEDGGGEAGDGGAGGGPEPGQGLGRVAPERQAADAPAQVEIKLASRTFWIDSFEASLDGSRRALSLASVLPANASWYEAKAACEAAGKRLCTTEEWVSACQGADAVDDDGNGNFADDYVEGNQFPYADWYEPRWCRDSEGESGSAGPTGGNPRCVTFSGIFDMGGNVAEWAGGSETEASLLGGDWKVEDKAGCVRPNKTFGPGHKNVGIGFRCCSDGPVANKGGAAVAAAAPDSMLDKAVPAFEVGLMDEAASLKSSNFKGKVTYLNFFASWCGPCRREMPELNALHGKYAARGFQVIGVGVDRDEPEKSAAMAKKLGVSFPVALDPLNKVLGLFDVRSMPTTYILDKKGVIRHKQVGFGDKTIETVTPVIEKLLGE